MNTWSIAVDYVPNPADSPSVAVQKQRQWAGEVRDEDLPAPLRTLAAVDVHLGPQTAIAVAALVTFPALGAVAVVSAEAPLSFPYVPGLLSWREAPAAIAALQMLPHPPDVLIADGHGRAHPRRFGLACHLGLITGLPTIGCAKSRLVGRYEPLPEDAGSTSPLVDKGEVIGTVLRTRAGVSPVFVSVGHRVTLDAAVEIIRAAAARTRLPEPSRLAHNEAQRLARAARQEGEQT